MASRVFERMQSTYYDTRWSVRDTRGGKTESLVDYIVLAEFDIDTGDYDKLIVYMLFDLLYYVGSTVRYQYPENIPGYKDDWFAEHMLPEGAHNVSVLSYNFHILKVCIAA